MTGRLGVLDDPDYPPYTTGQAAEVLGVQQAFLRSLDAAAAVRPQRTPGRAPPLQPPPARLRRPDQEPDRPGCTPAAARRIAGLEDDLATERALTARLFERPGGQPGPGT